MEGKNFIYRAQKQLDPTIMKSAMNAEDYIYTIQRNVMIRWADILDDLIVEMLHKEFLESDAAELIVMGKAEFREFLMKYLPMYVKENQASSKIDYTRFYNKEVKNEKESI